MGDRFRFRDDRGLRASINRHRPKPEEPAVADQVVKIGRPARAIEAVLCPHLGAKHFAKGRCRACYEAHRRSTKTPDQRQRDAASSRTHYAKNKDERNARLRARYGKRAPTANREISLLQRYGLTIEDYDRLLEAQGGVCAICKLPSRAKKHRHLYVDHNHKTGSVRGLLCPGCNSAIGQFADDPETLHVAIEYLRKAESNG